MRKINDCTISVKKAVFGEQEIIDGMPAGDYIAVFGTSHTFGECLRGDDNQLDESDMWAFQLAKRLGLGLLNASKRGNYNVNIVRQLIDFLDLPSDVLSRCKLIIVEPRDGDPAGIWCTELLGDLHLPDHTYNTPIVDSYQYHNYAMTWTGQLFQTFINPIQIGMSVSDYGRNEAFFMGNLLGFPIITEGAVNNVISYIDHHQKLVAGSVSKLTDDYDHIRIMQKLVKLSGIPYMWFCFDELDLDSEFEKVREIYKKTTNIYESAVPILHNMPLSYMKMNGLSSLDNNLKCECGHYGEEMNRWVSDIIYDEILLTHPTIIDGDA